MSTTKFQPGAARVRGVALVEALVALAVMAFGLLGVVGMQSTLRLNADVSRQRAEAVRMAQETMEEMRSFGVLSGAPGGEHDYTKIISSSATGVTTVAGFANTTFSRTVTVTTPGANDPKMKSIEVEVAWLDRRTATGGPEEKIKLTSTIAEVAPILGATLGLPADRSAPQRPTGRNVAIPPGAVSQPGGIISIFAPPNAPAGVSWTFSNTTGQITNVCTSAGTCTNINGLLLSGFIRFIPINTLPTDAQGELSSGLEINYPVLDMTVTLSVPAAPAVPPACFVDVFSPRTRQYYCFVPVTVTFPRIWSGQSLFSVPIIDPRQISTVLSDTTSTNIKVCRYTPTDTHTPAGGNKDHPLTYTAVGGALTNQNFLVHSAGNGALVAYGCPNDGPDPLIQSNTFDHQPN